MTLLSPQLEAFLAVVEHKTVHGAAQAIHLTQTAVTQRIRGLERNLKSTLFIRSRRGMDLTHEGKALLRYCNAVKTLEGETLAAISGAGIEAEVALRVSGPSSIMHSRIIPVAEKQHILFPKLLFHFDINNTDNRHETLRRGECDLAIITELELAQEMAYKLLEPEEYVLVCTSAWKGRPLQNIIDEEKIIDFDPSDQMTFNYLKHHGLLKAMQMRRHFANSTESIAELTAKGIGYTTLTREFAQTFVQQGQLIILNQGKVYIYQPVLAWYPRPEMPGYLADFISAIY